MFGFGSRSKLNTLTPAQVRTLADAGGATLVDVREPAEWATGHIAGAIHIPLGRLAAHLDDIPAGKPAIFYCQAGGRSAKAVALATAAGYPHDTHMGGGIGAWKAQGYPTTR